MDTLVWAMKTNDFFSGSELSIPFPQVFIGPLEVSQVDFTDTSATWNCGTW